MNDFITKLKTFESLFLYNYSTYDKNNNKLKIYLISPDQYHQYITVDLCASIPNIYECEIGDLYFMDHGVFEDTPHIVFNISKKNKLDYQEYHKKKRVWDKRDASAIKKSFSSINLTI